MWNKAFSPPFLSSIPPLLLFLWSQLHSWTLALNKAGFKQWSETGPCFDLESWLCFHVLTLTHLKNVWKESSRFSRYSLIYWTLGYVLKKSCQVAKQHLFFVYMILRIWIFGIIQSTIDWICPELLFAKILSKVKSMISSLVSLTGLLWGIFLWKAFIDFS